MDDLLEKNWARLNAYLESDKNISDVMYRNLIACYNEPHRHFHTSDHLVNILNFLDVDARPDEDAATLIAVTFWHDAIYMTDTVENIALNEARSAEMSRHDLAALGAPQKFIDNVSDIIVATKSHMWDPLERIGAAFMDADLSGLALPPEKYVGTCALVAREFANFAGPMFNTARCEKFITPMLNKRPLYLLPENEAALGDKARANLRREQCALS